MGSFEFAIDFRENRLFCRGDVLNRPLRIFWKISEIPKGSGYAP